MRPTTVLIDLAALRRNLAEAKRRAAPARVVAVVKADAYGHGGCRVLPALEAADMLGVAGIEEALSLRAAGAVQPILLLEGAFTADELPACAAQGFEIVVHEPGQIGMLEKARLARPLQVWLKVDSGMGRLGFRPEAARDARQRLAACPAVAPDIRLMSHLAGADAPGDEGTVRQLARLRDLRDIPGERSFANSAGLLGWPESRADWVRPGIMLYGASPMLGRTGTDDGLQSVMTFRTRLIAVKEIARGEPVGYAGAWTAPEATRIGIAAAGYGDGYPRHAPSGTPVLVNGEVRPLVGRVSMDMIAVDLGAGATACVGDPVTLWGPDLPVETVAERAGTIAYELLCGITRRVRVEVTDAEGAEPARGDTGPAAAPPGLSALPRAASRRSG